MPRLTSGAWPLLSLLTILASLLPVDALYFYLDGTSQRCFFEELPKDTLVVGHYNAEQWNEQARSYTPNEYMGIFITVDEVFDNDHRVVSQRGAHKGRFTFSAADSGDHKICFTPQNAGSASQGWLTGGLPAGGVKLTLDLVIGETSAIESTDKGKIQDIVSKVRDLNGRLQDIRREQVFQREREAEFRDQSESTNARVLSHLRAFFIKQKLT
ncbi:hypothetical protein B0A49_01078 [Cryomyces minteri]|uniref:GOLD domain-containing protein n=1 Tax=Cryomyces minteri TaxID=331657 RepID=A0A4U0Y0I5_9PEZI|nr:hypothetical protein B0A49_01078 [Cryomyces minteri]